MRKDIARLLPLTIVLKSQLFSDFTRRIEIWLNFENFCQAREDIARLMREECAELARRVKDANEGKILRKETYICRKRRVKETYLFPEDIAHLMCEECAEFARRAKDANEGKNLPQETYIYRKRRVKLTYLFAEDIASLTRE